MPIERPSRTTLRAAFRYAGAGLLLALRTQRNMRLHLAATVGVVALAAWLRLPRIEWAILVLAISSVWVAEMLNTAIEALVDLASPQHHDLARIAKDTAAAAVLVTAVAAVFIGLLIFGPYLLEGN